MTLCVQQQLSVLRVHRAPLRETVRRIEWKRKTQTKHWMHCVLPLKNTRNNINIKWNEQKMCVNSLLMSRPPDFSFIPLRLST